jgi:5,10-methylenetetrahydromethanopterin reductase
VALGLGSGDSAIYTLGAPPATVAGLEDAIDTLRSLTSGEAVRRAGRIWQVHRARRRVPIYLAAEGPRTLELAGRLADGVIVGSASPRGDPPVPRRHRARARGGAEPRRPRRVVVAKTNVADTRERR